MQADRDANRQASTLQRVNIGDGRFVVVKVLIDKPYEEFAFNLSGGLNPEDVIFNPRNAVLAEIEEESW